MFPIKQIYFSQIFSKLNVNMVLCEIWYHLYNLKNGKKTWSSVTFSKGAVFSLQIY